MDLSKIKVNLLACKTGAISTPVPKSHKNLETFESAMRSKFELISSNGDHKVWRVKGVSYIYVRVYTNGAIRVYLFGNFDTYRVLGADKTVDSVSTDGDIIYNILKDSHKSDV